MTVGPKGEISIETLGDLLDDGYGISWFCAAKCQGRRLGLTLERAIELWGLDRHYVAQDSWEPVTCSQCGGKRFSISLTAPQFLRRDHDRD